MQQFKKGNIRILRMYEKEINGIKQELLGIEKTIEQINAYKNSLEKSIKHLKILIKNIN